MNEFICSDCGRALGNDVALSWHRQGVHGADRGMVTASSGQDREARLNGERGESGHAPAAYGGGTSETAEPDDTVDDMKSDLRGWGIGLIVIGVAQYFLPVLDPLWAFVVVPLGVLSLVIAHRGLFIAIGAALVVVGLLNIFSGGFGVWTIYGGAQIYWGVQEFSKFGKYADAR